MAPSLTSSQVESVNTFMTITGAPKTAAKKIMKKHNYKVEPGINDYYNMSNQERLKLGGSGRPAANRSAIDALFTKYANADSGRIELEGVEAICEDLAIEPTDVRMLIMAWRLGAKTQCEFSKQEWTDGFVLLEADTMAKAATQLTALRDQIDAPHASPDNKRILKSVYEYTFDFALEPRRKTLDIAYANAYWDMLLHNKFPLLDKWKAFVEEAEHKVINKDCWCVLFDFFDEGLDGYDADGAWPVRIDEFVEFMEDAASDDDDL